MLSGILSQWLMMDAESVSRAVGKMCCTVPECREGRAQKTDIWVTLDVIVSELMEKKLRTAEDMGFETINAGECDPVEAVKEMTGGTGADAVIVAVGITAANEQALAMVKETDGRILFFAAGYPAPELKIDSNILHHRRLELFGTFAADSIDFFTDGEMLSSGAVDVSKLVEPETFTLDQVQEAFQCAATPGMYRVSIKLND